MTTVHSSLSRHQSNRRLDSSMISTRQGSTHMPRPTWQLRLPPHPSFATTTVMSLCPTQTIPTRVSSILCVPITANTSPLAVARLPCIPRKSRLRLHSDTRLWKYCPQLRLTPKLAAVSSPLLPRRDNPLLDQPITTLRRVRTTRAAGSPLRSSRQWRPFLLRPIHTPNPPA